MVHNIFITLSMFFGPLNSPFLDFDKTTLASEEVVVVMVIIPIHVIITIRELFSHLIAVGTTLDIFLVSTTQHAITITDYTSTYY